MDAKLIKKILDLHAKYLAGVGCGKKADLRGADLRGANLRGADNKKLTLIGDRPFIQIGPLGSRADTLLAFVTDGGVYVRAGRWFGPVKDFKKRVTETHKRNVHGREYAEAIKLIEAHMRLWKP